MWVCSNCGEESEDGFDFCWNCGTGKDGSAAAKDFVQQREADLETEAMNARTSTASVGKSVVPRYADAYVVARATAGFGQTVKSLAIILGVILVLVGGAIASDLGGFGLVAGIVLGVVVGLPIYLLGLLITAQGQILKATLDVAVNTSPLLTQDQMRKMMSLSDS